MVGVVRWFLLISCFSVVFNTQSESITVAVASNFHSTAETLAYEFQLITGVKVKLAPGASGVLYAQVVNGAPFDVLLSADKIRPQQLVEKGLAVFHRAYAIGKLALWVPQQYCQFDGKFLSNYRGRLAVANSKLAPYGAAAYQTLKSLKQIGEYQPRLITGNNASQVFQYVDSGNVAAGLVPESLLLLAQRKRKSEAAAKYRQYWLVTESLYQPIEQHAAVITSTQNIQQAKAFVEYLVSKQVQQYLKGVGYKPLTFE